MFKKKNTIIFIFILSLGINNEKKRTTRAKCKNECQRLTPMLIIINTKYRSFIKSNSICMNFLYHNKVFTIWQIIFRKS